MDYTLKQLVNDDDFKIHLTNVCKEYKENPEAVENCIDGLYHHASKHLHGRLPSPVELWEFDWQPTELAALVNIL